MYMHPTVIMICLNVVVIIIYSRIEKRIVHRNQVLTDSLTSQLANQFRNYENLI